MYHDTEKRIQYNHSALKNSSFLPIGKKTKEGGDDADYTYKTITFG